ncbi:unnamed protein product [Effrenium voratum]|nr:unnamed protein product [Effrenium voratum]
MHAWGRGEVQRFPTSCDQLQTGSYQDIVLGPVEPRFDICGMASNSFLSVRLDGPLIVQGNLTVRGTAVFRGPHTLAPFQEAMLTRIHSRRRFATGWACLQVTDGLTVSGFLWVEGCYNDAKDGKGGCLKASSLSMEEGRLELQHCQSKGCGGCAALGSLRQRAGVMSFTQCHAASGGGLDVGDLVQAGGEMAFLVCTAQHDGGGGLRAEKLSTSGAMLFERCESTAGGGAYVNHTLRQGSAGRLQCRNCSASRKGGCLFDSGGVAADGHVEAADVSAPHGSAMHVKGGAAFHTLVVSKADAPAVEVWGLLAAQELTAGPSERALEVKVWKGAMDVKSANCGEVVGCSLKVQAEYQNRTDLVLPRPHCRAGSGVDTSAGAGWVSYGCYKCPVTEFQFQQGAAAKCMPCPAVWTCTNNALQMRKGWMAPIGPEKLELAELNLTGEGRALQCLNEAACPGGAELPLDPAKPMCSEGRTGVLCAACTAGHYATEGKCEKCQEASQEDKLRLWKIAGCGAAISLGLAGVAWLSRGVVTERWKQADVRWHVLKELAARQAGLTWITFS